MFTHAGPNAPASSTTFLAPSDPLVQMHRGQASESGLRNPGELLSWLIAALRRNRVAIVCSGLLAAIILGILVAGMLKRFDAEAVVMIEPRQTRFVTFESVLSDPLPDVAVVRSEISVLRSNALAEAVIDAHALDKDPRIIRDLNGFSLPDLPWLSLAKVPGKPATRQNIIENILKRLSVYYEERSYVLEIHYESSDPAFAAFMANAFAKAYVADRVALRTRLGVQANTWLEEQLATLKTDVARSEDAVQAFMANNDLLETHGDTVAALQLTSLNSQLAEVSGRLIEAEARLTELRASANNRSALESTMAVLNSPLIQRLRERETDLLRQEAELKETLLPGHPRLASLREEISNLRGSISAEVKKMVLSTTNEVKALDTQRTELTGAVEQLKGVIAEASRSQVKLKELQRIAEANRTLYESLLARARQMKVTRELEQPEARIVSAAAVPLRQAFPGKNLLFAMALLGGAGMGFALGILLELRRRGIHTVSEVEDKIGISALASVPRASRRKRPADLIIREPNGTYAEAINTLWANLEPLIPSNRGLVLLVSSALPEEGKSTLAGSIARNAALGGCKTLLIDADLRRPGVVRALGLEDCPSNGTEAVLGGQAELADCVVTDPLSPLSILPLSAPIHNPGALLKTKPISKLLNEAQRHYAVIVVDTSPILAVSDAQFFANHADIIILAIRWEKTERRIVESAIRLLEKSVGLDRVAAAITQVDLRKHAIYRYKDQSDFYARYGNYYTASASSRG